MTNPKISSEINSGTQPRSRAVVLLSGGLDSATCLAIASQNYDCYAISFAYGQRHNSELAAAARVAKALGAVDHRVINIDLGGIGGSALTDTTIDVPETASEGIPVTYVPARNTVFLAFALGFAEVVKADAIVIGVNAVDYSGYPDCRPEYIAAFQQLANLATKSGIEGRPLLVDTPLLHLSKAEIIEQGLKLGVDYRLTVSCYQADSEGRACGKCDSCRLRREGFVNAGVTDPTYYY